MHLYLNPQLWFSMIRLDTAMAIATTKYKEHIQQLPQTSLKVCHLVCHVIILYTIYLYGYQYYPQQPCLTENCGPLFFLYNGLWYWLVAEDYKKINLWNIFLDQVLPDWVHSNHPCPLVCSSIRPSVGWSIFEYLRDRSLVFSKILHQVGGQ